MSHSCSNSYTIESEYFDGFQFIQKLICTFHTQDNISDCGSRKTISYKTTPQNLMGCSARPSEYHSFEDEQTSNTILREKQVPKEKRIPIYTQKVNNIILSEERDEYVTVLRQCTACKSVLPLTYQNIKR